MSEDVSYTPGVFGGRQAPQYTRTGEWEIMADKSVLLWVVGVAACALGAFLLLLGLAGVRWPLTGWRITSRSRVVAVSSIGAVALLGGTFILSRLAFYVIAGVVVGPFLLIALLTTASLGGFLMQFTEPLAPSRRKVGRRRRREIAEDNATYLESLCRRYAEGSWSEMDWEGLWSQCSDRVAPRSRKQRGRALQQQNRDALPGFLEFILTQCSLGGHESVPARALYRAYRAWLRKRKAISFARSDFDKMVLFWTGAERLGYVWTALAHGRFFDRSWGAVEHRPRQ